MGDRTLGIKKVMRAGAVLGLIGFLAGRADTWRVRGRHAVLSLGMSMIGFLTILLTVRWFEQRPAEAMSS